MYPHIYSQLIYDYRIKNIQWWKGSIYKKCWEKLDTYMQKEETRTLPLGSYPWVLTQNGKDLNVRSETIKPLEENISSKLSDNSLGDDFFDLTPSENHSVMFNFLWPHGLHHARASLSITFSQKLLKLMSIESVMPSNHLIFCCPFSSCLQSFPASGSFPMRWLVTSGGQSIGASVSASVLPKNVQNWFPLGLTGLISLQSKGLSRVFSNITVQKHQFFSTQPFLWSNSHICTKLLEGPSFNFMVVVTIHSDFGAQENKICVCFHISPFYLSKSNETRCHDLSFLNVEF